MKKNNGGYVLIYVMIVITIVSAMALAVSSVALRNYQVQQTAVERMKNLYAAEGEIERFYAWVKAQNSFNNAAVNDYPTSVGPPLVPPADPPVEVNVEVTDPPAGTTSYTITVTAKADNTTVKAVMEATVDGTGNVADITYTSYDIT